MKQPGIFIVEDDRQIQTFLKFVLEKENYICFQAESGTSGLEILSRESPDVILLDLGLPDLDGMILIQKIRQNSDIPILVISARDQDEEKALALDLGADDYLTKPFSATELLARIRTAIRHSQPRQKNSPAFKVGNLELNTESHKVSLNGKEIHLTPLEFKLLETFHESRQGFNGTDDHSKCLWDSLFPGYKSAANLNGRTKTKDRTGSRPSHLYSDRNWCRISPGGWVKPSGLKIHADFQEQRAAPVIAKKASGSRPFQAKEAESAGRDLKKSAAGK